MLLRLRIRGIIFIRFMVSNSLIQLTQVHPKVNPAIDFSAVNWTAFADTIPAMFALTFFGVLHVPINVPALGISTGEDNLNVDRELMAHGVTNALSGLSGSIQVRETSMKKTGWMVLIA